MSFILKRLRQKIMFNLWSNKNYVNQKSLRKKAEKLKLFDETFYLKIYFDVKQAGVDPFEHYCCSGWKERRLPNRHINLDKYVDLKKFLELDVCPLEDICGNKELVEKILFDIMPKTNLSGEKVFCIGQNKTGTTSLEKVLENMGFLMGCQSEAELLLEEWHLRNFHNIIEYCSTADAFQDIPFSLDYLYVVLDHFFPKAKFILTIRNSPEEWFESLVRFHSKLLLNGQKIPTADDLQKYEYRGKGYLWNAARWIYGVEENTLYNRELYLKKYKLQNENVMKYFKFKNEKLLVLNLADNDALERLHDFLNMPYRGEKMPHLNASK